MLGVAAAIARMILMRGPTNPDSFQWPSIMRVFLSGLSDLTPLAFFKTSVVIIVVVSAITFVILSRLTRSDEGGI